MHAAAGASGSITTPAILERWLESPESERFECKEAKRNFDFRELARYCAAIANEGGGKMILGVTDKRPRRVVGTHAFQQPGRTAAGLTERLRIKVVCEELQHSNGRVLVMHIPARYLGIPVQDDGVYWQRAGDSLRPMPPEELRRVFDETGPDFSAGICADATLDDLDPALIERFREMWSRKSGNAALGPLGQWELLDDAELLADGQVTRAALILLGSRIGLGRHMAQAEVVFEYRSSEASVSYQQRVEFRKGLLGILDELWGWIGRWNEILQVQEGFVRRDIPAFNEAVVREAILNALAHRDYRLGGSIFVRQFPRKLEIVSPGGFPLGITVENMLWKQSPRNRRIAEACAKCGLVERSGQGANRMFEESIKEGKPKPDFSGTDDYQVSLTLRGEIQNPMFVRFLERVGRERLATFSTRDLLTLDALHREESLTEDLKECLPELTEQGVIAKVARGRYILSSRFHTFLGRRGAYTRKKGLDRETNKALLIKHLESSNGAGTAMKEFEEVLPALSRSQIRQLLQELRSETRIRPRGERRGARWYMLPKKSEL